MKQEKLFPIVKIGKEKTLGIFIEISFSFQFAALIRQDGQEKMIEWSKSVLDSINTSYRYEFLDIRINEVREEMKSGKYTRKV